MRLNQVLIAKEKILKNNSDTPYRHSQTNVITQEGRAYFPYRDFWQGEYMSDLPIIAEREAGFRPRLEKSWKDRRHDELALAGEIPKEPQDILFPNISSKLITELSELVLQNRYRSQNRKILMYR